MKRLFFIFALLLCVPAWAAEVIPPAPQHYFNDYAHVTSPATADRLNRQLEDFEKQTSSQIVVAVYPKMQSDSSVFDYTVRVARAWKVGQQKKDNGAILFVFTQDHKMFIQVGYGLEGALPDAVCKEIIDNLIAPRFKQGDFDGGLSTGVAAMMAAAKGEYKGTGHTVAETKQESNIGSRLVPAIFEALIITFILYSMWKGFTGRDGRSGGGGGWWIGGGGFGGGGWGGGSDGGGGSSGGGGGGGGFSGGGGSFGGGGAGGSW